LALAYAIFAGFGAVAILAWAKKRGEILLSCAGLVVLIVPILFTPTMFWGFAGQLSPRHYPADWFTINQLFKRDTDDFRVLALPWHLYMHYPFAGRVIVNPSEDFFDKPVIASNELEFMGASPTFPDTDKKLLSQKILPGAAQNPQLAQDLAGLHIKYLLLAKTFDYKDYNYLDTQPNFRLLSETPNLKVYRNNAYEQ
jgi:hypothetical protein